MEANNKQLPPGLQLDRGCHIAGWAEIEAPARLWIGVSVRDTRLGAYSYIAPHTSVVAADIGRYCSIGDHTQIGSSLHPTGHLSSSPVFYQRVFSTQRWPAATPPAEFDRVHIGHDVWIGSHARILPGVSIGTGAVIGMGAVVAKDVPPYAVVVGNPGIVKKSRFAPEVCARLLASEWWNHDWPALEAAAGIDWADPLAALAQLEALRAQAPLLGRQITRFT